MPLQITDHVRLDSSADSWTGTCWASASLDDNHHPGRQADLLTLGVDEENHVDYSIRMPGAAVEGVSVSDVSAASPNAERGQTPAELGALVDHPDLAALLV